MERFEVQDIHVSDALLNKDHTEVFKYLSIRVKINMEAVQDLRTKGPTDEEISQQLGEAVSKAISEKCSQMYTPFDATDKYKMPFDIKEKAEPNMAGWYRVQ
jgi:hypothetical protein